MVISYVIIISIIIGNIVCYEDIALTGSVRFTKTESMLASRSLTLHVHTRTQTM